MGKSVLMGKRTYKIATAEEPHRNDIRMEDNMLQNINILTGVTPVRTGDTDRDILALTEFNERLMKALEYSLEMLDDTTDKMQKRLEAAEKEIKKLREKG